jgi:hypothetical protein
MLFGKRPESDTMRGRALQMRDRGRHDLARTPKARNTALSAAKLREYVTDSLLERDGFGLPVPSASHETVKPSWETGLLSRKRGADLVRNRRFESISLHR